jgi:hypothetical protein
LEYLHEGFPVSISSKPGNADLLSILLGNAVNAVKENLSFISALLLIELFDLRLDRDDAIKESCTKVISEDQVGRTLCSWLIISGGRSVLGLNAEVSHVLL